MAKPVDAKALKKAKQLFADDPTLTHQQIADRVGVSRGTISRLFIGEYEERRSPYTRTMKLCREHRCYMPCVACQAEECKRRMKDGK